MVPCYGVLKTKQKGSGTTLTKTQRMACLYYQDYDHNTNHVNRDHARASTQSFIYHGGGKKGSL